MTRLARRILFVECFHRGRGHQVVNGSLLASAIQAFEPEHVAVLAHPTHLDAIRELRAATLPENAEDNLEYLGLELFDSWSVVRSEEWKRIRTILEVVRQGQFDLVIFGTIMVPQFAALKFLAPVLASTSLFLVANHSMPEGFAWPERLGYEVNVWRHQLRASVLRTRWPRNIRLLVYGAGLAARSREELSPGIDTLEEIELPNLLAGRRGWRQSGDLQGADPAITFGFVGTAFKQGWGTLRDLIPRLRNRARNARFVAVGWSEDPSMGEFFDGGIPSASLSFREFQCRLEGLDYVLQLPRRDQYRYNGSGVLVDALAAGKPGIYLRCPHVEDLARRFPMACVVCDDLASFENAVVIAARAGRDSNYWARVQEIDRAALEHGTSAVARRLVEIVREARRA